MFNINFVDDWIQTLGPLVSEATALPIKPQPLPLAINHLLNQLYA